MNADVRWKQRFENFQKAFQKLVEAVAYIKNNDSKVEVILDEIIKEGLIQRFKYTHELAWNVMKDYASYQGNATVGGSRDATREAFQFQLMSDGAVWMDIIGCRNKTSHTYNEATADEIYLKILNDYFPAFLEFQKNMEYKMSID
jgi:nucleotidyltransferase substrate binding protein (TIGR01987 family)